MSRDKQSPPAPRALPPRPACAPVSAEDAIARKLAREHRDAQVRGVTSIADMRAAIRRAARALPAIDAVPVMGMLDGAAFRARAQQGLPFLMRGLVQRWPLS